MDAEDNQLAPKAIEPPPAARRPRAEYLPHVRALLRRVNVQKMKEDISEAVIEARGTPTGKPDRPGDAFLRTFLIFYFGHGIAIFLTYFWNRLPEFALFTNFFFCLRSLLFWPTLAFGYSSFVLITGYILVGIACAYYAARLTIQNPSYDWQRELSRAEDEGAKRLASAKAEAAQALEQAERRTQEAKAEMASASEQAEQRFVTAIAEADKLMNGAAQRIAELEAERNDFQGRWTTSEATAKGERERHEKEEAALRQAIAEGTQRERLLIFQRDAGSSPAPQGRIYEGVAEILPPENSSKPADPIEELYGD